MTGMVFATYAESDEQLRHVCKMAESLRAFGGRFKDAPLWLYLPSHYTVRDSSLVERLSISEVQTFECITPEKAKWCYYAGKTYAAGDAESRAEKEAVVLVWLDEDTIFLREPEAFHLAKDVSLGYRPVMHNRSGVQYRAEPNEFWGRIYELLEIDRDLLFPMVTPADRVEINAYFNAGLLVTRPKARILRSWGECFSTLCADTLLRKLCEENVTNRIFLHQTALVGAVIGRIDRSEMIELPEDYNYPMFFRYQYGGLNDFDDISGVVTLRYDTYFHHPEPNWPDKLRGPKDRIDWLREKLSGE